MPTPVVALANQKGGVGKTACTLLFAAAARRAGARVLVLDLDAQANATDVLLRDEERGVGIYGLMADRKQGGGVDLQDAIQPASSAWAGVDVVPSMPALADIDTDISPTQPMRLRRALNAGADVLSGYDVVLMDCPPNIGRVLIAGLVAATDVVIVTEPSSHGLNGVSRLEETVQEVRQGFEQSTPRLTGIVVNRWRRASEHHFREAELRTSYGDLVLRGSIPERVAVADAASGGVPIYDVTGAGSGAVAAVIDAFWRELRTRLQIPVTTTVGGHR